MSAAGMRFASGEGEEGREMVAGDGDEEERRTDGEEETGRREEAVATTTVFVGEVVVPPTTTTAAAWEVVNWACLAVVAVVVGEKTLRVVVVVGLKERGRGRRR